MALAAESLHLNHSHRGTHTTIMNLYTYTKLVQNMLQTKMNMKAYITDTNTTNKIQHNYNEQIYLIPPN